METMFYRLSIIAVALAVVFILGLTPSTVAQVNELPSDTSDSSATQSPEVMEVLKERSEYSALTSALQRTGLDQALGINGEFTLLAPTDSAFSALDVSLSQMESEDVAEILRNHILRKSMTTDQLKGVNEVENTRGIGLKVGSNAETIGDVTLVESDIKARNGVIHGIDAVLTMKTKADGTAAVKGY